MLVPKIPIDVHLRKHIGRTIGYCGHCPNPVVAYHTYSIDPEAELLCPAIGIDPQNRRPIVVPIAYKKELNGTETGRSKTLQA